MIVAACIALVVAVAAAVALVVARLAPDEFAREVTASARARSGLARAVEQPHARGGHPPGSP